MIEFIDVFWYQYQFYGLVLLQVTWEGPIVWSKKRSYVIAMIHTQNTAES
jgi:hypothetical protein